MLRNKSTVSGSPISGFVALLALMFLVFSLPSDVFGSQATLSWDPPTTNVDGTPLTDLGGYEVYYGTAPRTGSSYVYPNVRTVGLVTTATIQHSDPTSAPVTYYYAVKAVDTSGNRSDYSNEVSKTFQPPAQTYTITASAGTGGTISPSGAVIVSQGMSQAFAITANTGYNVASVMVDGVSMGAATSFVFGNVTGNHTISATFSASLTNGACGSSSGRTFISTPSTNLCSAGAATVVSGSGPWTWSCVGLNGGTTATCSANIQSWTVTASAGAGGSITPSGSVTVSQGTTKQFTVTPNGGYIATVGGTCGGSPASGASPFIYTTNAVMNNCSVVATFTANPVNGGCGTSNGATFTSAPSTNLCSAGTSTAVSGSGPWAWSCTGVNGGTTASCSAYVKINGVCGSSSGRTFTSAPSTNLCSAGTATAVSGSGPWTWSCIGLNGGTTTSCSANIDSDGDGLTDQEESGPAGDNPGYDGNGDGIGDRLQSNVASFHTFGNLAYVTLFSPEGSPLRAVSPQLVPPSSPAGVNFPYSFMEFSIDNLAQGAAATVQLILPQGTAINTYYKYGPTPDNKTPHWYEFMYDGQTGAEIAGNIVTLHFVDGMRGDDDLTLNGFIIDQGGPARAADIAASPSAVNFGSSAVGTLSSPQTITITNIGLANLSVGKVVLQGGAASEFTIQSNNCSNGRLAPSATCRVSVVFAPATFGTKQAVLAVPSSDPSSPVFNVALTGQASALPATYTITASAGAGGSISPSGMVKVNSGGIQSFGVKPGTGYLIRDVLVDGVSAGPLSTVTFSNVTANHSVSAAFSQIGTAPNITVSQSAVNFRSVKVGWTVSSAVKITNTGNTPLSVLAPIITGPDAAMFSIKSAGQVTLGPGSSTTVKVRFTPTSRGLKSAGLGIKSNDPDTPMVTVSLSGAGF